MVSIVSHGLYILDRPVLNSSAVFQKFGMNVSPKRSGRTPKKQNGHINGGRSAVDVGNVPERNGAKAVQVRRPDQSQGFSCMPYR